MKWSQLYNYRVLQLNFDCLLIFSITAELFCVTAEFFNYQVQVATVVLTHLFSFSMAVICWQGFSTLQWYLFSSAKKAKGVAKLLIQLLN